MNYAYPLAGLGALLYGGADFCGGLTARRAPALAVTFYSGFAAVLVLLIGLPFAPGVVRAPDLMWGTLGGIFGGFGAMMVYRALAIGPVSVASPVLSLTGLALPVVVGLALQGRPGAIALAGLALVPLAIVLLTRDSAPSVGAAPPDAADAMAASASAGTGTAAPADPIAPPHGVLGPALSAGVMLGMFLVCLGRIGPGAGLVPLIVARLAGMATLLLALFASRQALLPPAGARRMSLGTGVLDSLANVAYVTAVAGGSLALVAALVSLAPAITVLLARVLMGERWGVAQRFGLATALVAGACISLG